MVFKLVALFALVAVASAGLLSAPTAYSSQSFVQSAPVYSRQLIAAPQPIAYAAPQVIAHAAPQPLAYSSQQVITHAAPQIIAHPAPQHIAYAAPQVIAHAAPQVIAHAAPQVIAHAAPQLYAAAPLVKTIAAEPYDANPQYAFAYSVEDSLTGDSKNQQESRSGDVVQGSYSLNDPDGTRRTVDYIADPINGFNAVVRKEPLGVAVKTISPVQTLVGR